MIDWPFGAMRPLSYDFIMADPPWSFDNFSAAGEAKNAKAQYACMDLAAIKALPVGQLAARDCVLWLWATNPMLPQAIETLAAWGFTFKTAKKRAIVTNPPYAEINARDGHGRWLRHTLEMEGWDYCAFLLSWDWPAARQNGLGALLDANPFSYCYLMRWKLDFSGEGSPPQRNGWFVWDKDYTGTPKVMHFMNRDDGKAINQLELGL